MDRGPDFLIPRPHGLRGQRLAVVAGSLVVTAAMGYLAFALGAWGFDTRRFLQHERRLQGLVAETPRLDQVVQAFEDEGTVLVAQPASADELKRVAAERGGPKASAIVEKGLKWGRTLVFVAGDMQYFTFFDESSVMRDFTIVSR